MNYPDDRAAPGVLDSHNRLLRFVDPETGIIMVEGFGLWSDDSAAEHFAKMRGLLQVARSRSGRALVLIDLSAALVQTADISRRVQSDVADLYGPDDQIAIILTSSLLGLQMTRVSGRANYRHFSSRPEAMAWLKVGAARTA